MTSLAALRRFRFSLRTLFAVVTLIAITLPPAGWLGRELNWIRQRQAFREEQAAALGKQIAFRHGKPVAAPSQLSFFGERGYGIITVAVTQQRMEQLATADLASIQRAAALFPEARIVALQQSGNISRIVATLQDGRLVDSRRPPP